MMEAIKKKVILEDTSRVKDVHFHEELLNTKANKDAVKSLYAECKAAEEELKDLRMKIMELEEYYKRKHKRLAEILESCDLEFPTYEKEIVDYQVNLLLKNVGNEIIGYKNS